VISLITGSSTGILQPRERIIAIHAALVGSQCHKSIKCPALPRCTQLLHRAGPVFVVL